LKFEIIRKKSR